VLTFPLAVRKKFYDDPVPEKSLDVAMVGRLHGQQYAYRRSCVATVRRSYEMNDVEKEYDYSELSQLYRSAKIGLNVSRDDHLQDANLRCFEVMAGGALLVTPQPSELSDLELEEGEHFVGFQSEEELLDTISYYLQHDSERKEIAQRGREMTLKRFTYDYWAERLIERIREGIPRQAPARTMTKSEAASIYVDYFSKRGKLNQALNHLKRQREAGSIDKLLLESTWKGAKATVRRWQRALFA
jgi:spore maturation protein CgeB